MPDCRMKNRNEAVKGERHDIDCLVEACRLRLCDSKIPQCGTAYMPIDVVQQGQWCPDTGVADCCQPLWRVGCTIIRPCLRLLSLSTTRPLKTGRAKGESHHVSAWWVLMTKRVIGGSIYCDLIAMIMVVVLLVALQIKTNYHICILVPTLNLRS